MTDKHLIGITKRGSDGFRLTEVSVIKKKKIFELVSKEVSSKENLQIISEEADNETQTTSKEAIKEENSEEQQITSEEAIMSVNNEVIVHESITISD